MNSPLDPSFRGTVETSRDAPILITLALHYKIPMTTRCPHKMEQQSVIVSGNVFLFYEETSSIKRWTDGGTWSLSQKMGNVLTYRKLNGMCPPREGKQVLKKIKSQGSYSFNHNELVKKTIMVKFNGCTIRMVAYYDLQHALSGELVQPYQYPELANTVIIDGLARSPTFRIPLDNFGNELPAITNRQARPPEIVAPLDPQVPVNSVSESIPVTDSEDLFYDPTSGVFFDRYGLPMVENDLDF